MAIVGAVLVTHGTIGDSLLESLHCIVGACNQVSSVNISPGEDNEAMLGRIRAAVAEVNSGDGVLIFTDMFGGTPSNLSLTVFKKGAVEVVTGVNLPMLVKYFNYRDSCTLGDLAEGVKKAGRNAISLASDFSPGGHPEGQSPTPRSR